MGVSGVCRRVCVCVCVCVKGVRGRGGVEVWACLGEGCVGGVAVGCVFGLRGCGGVWVAFQQRSGTCAQLRLC